MSTVLATTRTGNFAPSSARVLVVAGSEGAADIVEALGRSGHAVDERKQLDEDALAGAPYDIVFVDSGQVETVRSLVEARGTPVVTIGDEGATDSEAQLSSCIGVVPRLGGEAAMSLLVDLLIERSFLFQRCQELEVLVAGVRDGSAFVGGSPVMRRLHSALSRAAGTDATVLIEGAPGSGKSLAARIVHCKSKRGDRGLVVREGEELDGEALQQVIEAARGSTLLIEDVDQMPAPGQHALVRFLKERPQHSGDDATTRIVVTTAAHLPELVARGAFREDLYYRLHAYPVVVPSLRERAADIPMLARSLLDQMVGGSGSRPAGFTAEALSTLENMTWPGNVAQLENVVRRAFLMSGGAAIDNSHLQVGGEEASTGAVAQPAVDPDEFGELTEAAIRPFDEEEQRLLSRALRATRGNVRRAAQLLGIGRATLYRKIQQYRLRLQ